MFVSVALGRALVRPGEVSCPVEDSASTVEPVVLCYASVWERVFDTLAANWDNNCLMLHSAIVRAHQKTATEKGQGSGAGAFLRWTDDQGPYAGRHVWQAAALPDDGWPDARHRRRC